MSEDDDREKDEARFGRLIEHFSHSLSHFQFLLFSVRLCFAFFPLSRRSAIDESTHLALPRRNGADEGGCSQHALQHTVETKEKK